MRPTKNKAPSYLQDEDGFARLIDDWGDRLLRLCTLYLGDVHLAEDAVQETLPRAIMALSRPYREVIILYYYQELKAREIADILHVDVSTVTARLSRARKQLREALKGWYYDE